MSTDPVGLNEAPGHDSSAACAEDHLDRATSETRVKVNMALTAKGVTITMSTDFP